MVFKMKRGKILIAPSILSADFSQLGREIKSVEQAKADLLHIDVMDGHFVRNITIGPDVVKSIRKKTKLLLDVHLMIENPLFFLEPFIKAGSDIITVHIEVCSHRVIQEIKTSLKKNKIKFGVSLNPGTSLKKIEKILGIIDMVLVMSVNPGFAGQKFIRKTLSKIRNLRRIYNGDIEVDGGITDETAPLVVEQGANILVAGSYIFHAQDRKKTITRLKDASNKIRH